MNKHTPPHLPSAAEQLLLAWPAPARDDAAWEESAQRVVAELANVSIGSTDEALLAAPLPQQADDEATSARPATSAPGVRSRSLADMARASVARKEADDGAEDLARETLSLAARSRPSASEIVERVRQRADSSGNIARLDQAREDARSSAPPSRRSRPAGLAARTLRKAPLIGTVIVLTGMAAALALVVNRSGDDAPGTEQAATPAMQAPGVAPAAEVHAPSDNALTVDDLPQQAEPRAPAAGAPRAPAGAVARARPAAKPADAPKAEPAPLAQKTAPQEPAEDKSGPPPGMQRAEMPGGLPEKPSVGAVQAAMASVLGGARACVAGHSAPSSAVLVFGGLDGRVQSVTVQGPAAGTPSESCIRTALKQARVQPFALDTFTVRTTPIRP